MFEKLDDRQLLSVNAALAGGTLTVTGDAASNSISLFAQNGQIHVRGDGVTRSFRDTDVSFVDVQAAGGGDMVRIASSLPASIIRLTVDGGTGAGTDTLIAEEPIVTIWAKDSSADVLTGSDGGDWFFAKPEPRRLILGPRDPSWDRITDLVWFDLSRDRIERLS